MQKIMLVPLLSLDVDDASQHRHNVLYHYAKYTLILINGQDRWVSKQTQQNT